MVSGQLANDISAKADGEKNEKGSVSKTIIKVLSDGKPKTVEQVAIEANKLLDRPTTRASVRGTLANLSSLNKVIKIAYGEYAIHPQKGENLANFTATNSESEAFKLQPSPNQDDKLEDLIRR